MGDWLQKATEIYEKLAGAPGCILLVLLLIALGFALRAWPSLHNNTIPAILMIAGIGGFFILAPDRVVDPHLPGYLSLRLWIGRTAAMGGISGVVAWVLYRMVVRRLEKKLLNGSMELADLQKPTGEKTQPPKP